MMHSPATDVLYEACDLILAQIDAIESPEELTPDQLLEFQGRSEKIRVLCDQLVPHRTVLEEQLLESIELLESVA